MTEIVQERTDKPRDGDRASPSRNSFSGIRGRKPPTDKGLRTSGGDHSPSSILVTTYVNGKATEKTVTEEQARTLKPNGVDLHVDLVHGLIQIRPRTGPIIRHFGQIPGLGDKVGIPLLLELMFQPGCLLSGDDLARNPALKALRGPTYNALAVRIKVLRQAFGAKRQQQVPRRSKGSAAQRAVVDTWFFGTCRNPYRVFWNAKRGWRLLERLALPETVAHVGPPSAT